jgi:hypothetical protein
MLQCLNRDEGWKEYYINEMNEIPPHVQPNKLYSRLLEENEIEQYYIKNEFQKAIDVLQKYIDQYCDEDEEHGWYLQQLARYYFSIEDEIKSNEIQKSAFQKNSSLLKPKDGIVYKKISFISKSRLLRIKQYCNSFKSFEELKLTTDDLIEKLDFGVDSKKFESALQQLGELLGFESQRPDKEIRKGFDNLWCGVDNQYILFECKNEVLPTRKSINKDEVGQFNNHIAWFREEYASSAQASYFLIAPTKNISYAANFSDAVSIIKAGKLNELKKNVKSFVNSLSEYVLSDLTDELIQKSLDTFSLNQSDIIEKYSEDYYQERK